MELNVVKLEKRQLIVDDQLLPPRYEIRVFKYGKDGKPIGHDKMSDLTLEEMVEIRDILNAYELTNEQPK